METNQIIETTGCIAKVEHLHDIATFILDDTLVMKPSRPFPGLNIRIEEKTPGAVYIALLYRYFPEKINRIAKSLKDSINNDWWTVYGEIIIKNNLYPVVRIKGLNKYDEISVVQDYFKKNDIKLMPYKKINEEGKIKIFKQFKIKEITNGIYRDLYEPEKFYFVINDPINWNILTYLTKQIKRKIENPEFDAALGVINRFNGAEDVIRIYDKDKTLERAIYLRNLFFKAMKKENLLIAKKH